MNEKLKELRTNVLKEFDVLMEKIKNKNIMNISENEIQRQLGITFRSWEIYTNNQKLINYE